MNDPTSSRDRAGRAVLQADLHDDIDADQLARWVSRPTSWVIERVEAQCLHARLEADGRHRFTSATVWRAQTMSDIEAQYDADPQLAALVADLSEEIDRLRRTLRQAGLLLP